MCRSSQMCMGRNRTLYRVEALPPPSPEGNPCPKHGQTFQPRRFRPKGLAVETYTAITISYIFEGGFFVTQRHVQSLFSHRPLRRCTIREVDCQL